jgi:hypothetical protein
VAIGHSARLAKRGPGKNSAVNNIAQISRLPTLLDAGRPKICRGRIPPQNIGLKNNPIQTLALADAQADHGKEGGRGKKKTLGENCAKGLRAPRAIDNIGKFAGVSGRTQDRLPSILIHWISKGGKFGVSAGFVSGKTDPMAVPARTARPIRRPSRRNARKLAKPPGKKSGLKNNPHNFYPADARRTGEGWPSQKEFSC